MNIRTELIATAVRLLADNTSLVRKPTGFEAAFDSFLNEETYDRRIARNVEGEIDRVTNAVKQFRTNRQFTKITSNI